MKIKENVKVHGINGSPSSEGKSTEYLEPEDLIVLEF